MTCKVPGCPEPEHDESGCVLSLGTVRGTDFPVVTLEFQKEGSAPAEAITRMIAAAPARTHALVKLVAACYREHITVNDQPMGVLVCIECHTLKGSPHDADCAIGTALAEAEAALKP